jgi:PASTA domain
MRAPAPVIMLVLASVMVLAGCEPYQHRSAAEYVSPALYHAVTVTAVICCTGRPHTVSRRFTSAAVVTELADTLNRAPAAPAGLRQCSCPAAIAGYVWYYQLTFETAPGGLLTLQAYDGCCNFGVSVWGKDQPGLWGTGFADIAAKLLGIRPMPTVTGLEPSRARAVIRSAITDPRLTFQPSYTDGGPGVVVAQQPLPGTEVLPGGHIWLTVSAYQ